MTCCKFKKDLTRNLLGLFVFPSQQGPFRRSEGDVGRQLLRREEADLSRIVACAQRAAAILA